MAGCGDGHLSCTIYARALLKAFHGHGRTRQSPSITFQLGTPETADDEAGSVPESPMVLRMVQPADAEMQYLRPAAPLLGTSSLQMMGGKMSDGEGLDSPQNGLLMFFIPDNKAFSSSCERPTKAVRSRFPVQPLFALCAAVRIDATK